jgi:uncharacterized protein (DUF433 family)
MHADRRIDCMDWRNRISRDPRICHGKPCISGTRVLVTIVLDNLAAGISPQEIVESYHLSLDDIEAARLYATQEPGLYGYFDREVNEFGSVELREVTISAGPKVLRDIANFLDHAASEMESGFFEKCSHMHIDTVIQDWKESSPWKDIVVIPRTRATEPPVAKS